MLVKRLAIFALVAGTLVGLDAAGLQLHDGTEPGLPGNTPTTVCTEDMDCWDCEVHGNRICGTVQE